MFCNRTKRQGHRTHPTALSVLGDGQPFATGGSHRQHPVLSEPLPGEKLPFERVTLGRDLLWARALAEYRNGFQSFSTDAELDEIVGRNSGYDMPDPWEELISGFLERKAGAPYVELQEIYRHLEINPERQNGTNAKKITELAAEDGWVKTQKRIGRQGQRTNAFFPERVKSRCPS